MTETDADEPPATATPSDAFGVLGNETRTAVLRALLEERDEGAVPVTRTFSELHEATDEDTSAGFAYHLRQLVGHYVRKTDEGYRLTAAGRTAARDIAAGTYTERVDVDPVPVPDSCPHCGVAALEARGEDGVLTVGCTDCGRDILSLPLPPGADRTQDDLLAAFDRQHRHRIATMADGSCPDCGGAVERTVEPLDRPDAEGPDRVQARLGCRACGYRLRVPVTLAVRDHPAVVSLYHDHSLDVRDRPIWNVGPEWRERVLSTDPVAVRVTTAVEGERLALYVGRDLSVVRVERDQVDEEVDCEASERAAA